MESDSSQCTSDRTRDNGHNQEHRKFHLNIRKNLFHVRVTEPLEEAAHRGGGISVPRGFQNLPGRDATCSR